MDNNYLKAREWKFLHKCDTIVRGAHAEYVELRGVISDL